MSDLLAEVLIIFFEVLCCKMFYEIFGEIRHRGWINIVQLIILECCIFVAVRGLARMFIIKQIVMVSLFAVFMFWYMKISIKKSFILAVLYQALLLSIEYQAYSINVEIFFGHKMTGTKYDLGNVLVILLGKAILLLCILILKKQFGKKSIELFTDIEWLKFLIFPMFTIITIASMRYYFRYVETSEQKMLLFIGAFGMIGMNIVVFYLINDIVEREKQLYESRILQLQAESQAEKYQSISENFYKQKKRTHEYKTQIECVKSLLKKKQYSKLEEYVKEICGALGRELDAIDTNNIIVNAILNTKYQEAEENKIVFVLKVNDLSGLKIEDKDIVTILSNLLNNAIEACKKCECDRRIMKVKLVNEDGMIKIGVRNTFNGSILYENGEIRSTKLVRAEEHGVGIKNIIEVIEKYDGSYVIKENNQEFYFSIIIPA